MHNLLLHEETKALLEYLVIKLSSKESILPSSIWSQPWDQNKNYQRTEYKLDDQTFIETVRIYRLLQTALCSTKGHLNASPI